MDDDFSNMENRMKLQSLRRLSLSGFTIIELLVTISIIAVLVGMLLPAIATVRDQAKAMKCMKNQQQAVMACLAYANDHKSGLPASMISGTQNGYWPMMIKTYLEAIVVTNNNNSVTDSTAVCPEWKPPLTTYSLGPNAQLHYDGTSGTRSNSINCWPPSSPCVWVEFKLVSITSPSQRLYFADINGPGASNRAIYPGVNGGSTSSIAFRHRGRTQAIFVDGRGASIDQAEALRAVKGIY